MPKAESSYSESEEKGSTEEESENEGANEKGGRRNQEKLSDYERLRLKRIEENKSRMEALGLHKMANSFMGSVKESQKKKNDEKGKRKMVDEDEEYNPDQEDDEMSSSGGEDENDEEFSPSQKKVKRNTSTPKKRGGLIKKPESTTKKPIFDSDFVEDDDALMQAIALSLQDSPGFVDVRSNSPQSSDACPSNVASKHTIDTTSDERKENPYPKDDSGKSKRKKPGRQITSRVQMTEDEMLIHFFQFDETGKGGFTLGDVRRSATAHDFTWSEKEMADMIHCFDSNGDGKISLDDFRKIVVRCNMLKRSDDGVAVAGDS